MFFFGEAGTTQTLLGASLAFSSFRYALYTFYEHLEKICLTESLPSSYSYGNSHISSLQALLGAGEVVRKDDAVSARIAWGVWACKHCVPQAK